MRVAFRRGRASLSTSPSGRRRVSRLRRPRKPGCHDRAEFVEQSVRALAAERRRRDAERARERTREVAVAAVAELVRDPREIVTVLDSIERLPQTQVVPVVVEAEPGLPPEDAGEVEG